MMATGRVSDIASGHHQNCVGRAVFCNIRSTKRVSPSIWKPELNHLISNKLAEVEIFGSEKEGQDFQKRPFYVYRIFIVFPSLFQWTKLHLKLVEILLGRELQLHLHIVEVKIWDPYPDNNSPTDLFTFYGACSADIKQEGCLFGDEEAVFKECSEMSFGDKPQGQNRYTDYCLFQEQDGDHEGLPPFTGIGSHLLGIGMLDSDEPSSWVQSNTPLLPGLDTFYHEDSSSTENSFTAYGSKADERFLEDAGEEQYASLSGDGHQELNQLDTKQTDGGDECTSLLLRGDSDNREVLKADILAHKRGLCFKSGDFAVTT